MPTDSPQRRADRSPLNLPPADPASLPYRLMRLWARLSLELYFTDIQVVGAMPPTTGPVVFAANHPNSLMDTVVLGAVLPRSVHLLAKSVLFDNPVAAKVFNAAGVIPVYRRQDHPGQMVRNDDSFRRAFEVLEGGGAIGIFPEGENTPREDMVADLRTGAARIALGAEARNDFGLGVTVVPVGLNFVDRDQFLTSVLVRFGEPIRAADYADAWCQDERVAVRAMTDALQEALRVQVLHIEDELTRELVADIAEIYEPELFTDDPNHIRVGLLDQLRSNADRIEDLQLRFDTREEILALVQHLEDHDPQAVARLRGHLERYRAHLRQLAIKNEFLQRPDGTLSLRKEALRATSYAVFWGPAAVWGFIHNVVPFVLSRLAARFAPDEAMRAFAKVVVGSVTYSLAYAGFAWLAWQWQAPWWQVVLYLLTLPVSGFLSLRYLRQLLRYRNLILARVFFITNRMAMTDLRREHERLLGELERLRARWKRQTAKRNVSGAPSSAYVAEHKEER